MRFNFLSVLFEAGLLASLSLSHTIEEHSSTSSLAKRTCTVNPDSTQGLVETKLGYVQGYVGSNSIRYVLPYAKPPTQALRFRPPIPLRSFTATNHTYDATNLPNACPQDADPTIQATSDSNENCLYMTIYTPVNVTTCSGLATMVWIHGGTFVSGSSTMSGLDGSNLATKRNMIVVVLQYRLGVLGNLRSTALKIEGNQGLRDVASALRLIKSEIRAFGGDSNKILLAGQSSGAEMIKSLLVTPSVRGLFTAAALHSAPLNYNDFSIKTADAVGALVINSLNCTTLACLQSDSVGLKTLLSVQDQLFDPNSSIYPANTVSGITALSEPLRPIIDGVLVVHDFDAVTVSQGRVRISVPVPTIYSSVTHEACATIQNIAPSPLPEAYFYPILQNLLGDRADAVFNSSVYAPSKRANDPDAVRNSLETLGSEFIWTCPIQQSATNLSRTMRPIYLASFQLGISYSNDTIPFCQNKVAHEDDIYVLFGTAPNAISSAQQALSDEVQMRWSNFAATGSPNAAAYPSWPSIEGSKAYILGLGRATEFRPSYRMCSTAADRLLGRIVPFDSQLSA